jgi:dTDP-L-rhamnose 4-epimerase
MIPPDGSPNGGPHSVADGGTDGGPHSVAGSRPGGGPWSAAKQVLITGGAGFIGGHLAEGLLAAGHRVRVLDDRLPQTHAGGRPGSLAAGVEMVRGDVRDPKCVREALREVDVVFHLAATTRAGDSMYEISRAMSVNAQGTAELLQAMLDTKVTPEKLIVASSMSIYGEGQYVCSVCSRPACPRVRPVAQLEEARWEVHCADCGGVLLSRPTAESKHADAQSLYALSKRTQEELILIFGRTYGVPVTALRLFNVYGPGQTIANPYSSVATLFAARLLENAAPLLFEDGEQTRDFVHVRDVVGACLLAMEHASANGEVINVGYGVPIRMRRVAEILAAALEKEIEPVVTQKFHAGDIRHCYADVTKARKLLGYAPKVTHEQGLRELAAWLAEEQTSRLAMGGSEAAVLRPLELAAEPVARTV